MCRQTINITKRRMNKHNFCPSASSTNDEWLIKKESYLIFSINKHLCCRHIKHIDREVCWSHNFATIPFSLRKFIPLLCVIQKVTNYASKIKINKIIAQHSKQHQNQILLLCTWCSMAPTTFIVHYICLVLVHFHRFFYKCLSIFK